MVGYGVHGRTLLAAAILVALTACGGGGGGSNDNPVVNPPAATVSVSGLASKGLLAYAKVTAYAVKADGTADTANVLGSAITNDAGAYTITGLTPGVPVLLKVTPLAADGSRPATSMLDEVSHQRLTVATDSGFELSAVTVLDTTGTTSAQITPFTNMAAKLAQTQAAAATGGVTIGDVIRAANNSVSTALNIPILSEAPSFDNTGKPTNAAAVKLAAVAVLARNDGTCGAAAEDIAKVKCAVEKLRDEVPNAAPQAGTALLGTQLVAALNAAQAEAATDAGITNVADVSTGVTTAPVEGSAQTSAIARAKALFQSIRTAVNGLGNKADTQSLAYRTNVVSTAFDAVQSPANLEGVFSVFKVLEGMEQQGGATLQTTDWFYSTTDIAPGVIGGACKVFSTSAFTGGQAGDMRAATYVGCRLTFDFDMHNATPNGSGGYDNVIAMQYIVKATRNAIANGVESYNVKTLLVSQAGSYVPGTGFVQADSDAFDLTTLNGASTGGARWQEATVSRVSRGTDPYDPSRLAYNDLTISGAVAPNLAQIQWAQRSNVSLTGTEVSLFAGSESVNDANRVTKLNLRGSFALKAAGGATLSSMALKSGSYAQTRTGRVAYVNDPVVADESLAHLEFEASVLGGAVASGVLDVDQFVDLGAQGVNRAIPKRVVFTGSLKESAQASPLYTGSITYTQAHSNTNTAPATSSAYFDQRRVVLDGTVVSTGTNSITLSLTAQADAAGVGTLVGTYSQTGGSALYLDMTLGPVSEASFIKLRSDSAGIGVEVHGTADGRFAKSAPVLSNNTLVGLWNFDRGRVDYADNTYEQY